MPAPDWENLDLFLNTDDFGITVTINHKAGGSSTLRAIFDDPYINAQLGEYQPDITDPRLTVKQLDAINVKKHDYCTINDKTYDVLTAPQPDGSGMAIIRLAARATA